MHHKLLNINGIIGENLKDIKGEYYIIKKTDEIYDSNIKFYRE